MKLLRRIEPLFPRIAPRGPRPAPASSPSTRVSPWLLSTLLVGLLGFGTTPARSLDFRAGQLHWERSGEDSVRVTARISFRRSGLTSCLDVNSLLGTRCSGNDGLPEPGDVVLDLATQTTLDWSDESTPAGSPFGPLLYLVTAADADADSISGVALDSAALPNLVPALSHTFAAPGDYIASLSGCCRADQVNNPREDFRLETAIAVGSGNDPPVGSLVPVVACVVGETCEFAVSATDPNGDPLHFALLESTAPAICRACFGQLESLGLCTNACEEPPALLDCDLDPTRTIFAGGSGSVACGQFDGDAASCNASFHEGNRGIASCYVDASTGDCRGCGPPNESVGRCENTCTPPPACEGDANRTNFLEGRPAFIACGFLDGDPDACEASWGLTSAGPTSCFAAADPSIGNLDQPGPPFAPAAAGIDPETGIYAWDSSGAELASDGEATLYSTQVVVSDDTSSTSLDFLIQLLPSPPDCTGVTPDPSILWPPRKQLNEVVLSGATHPDGLEVALRVDRITQDEPLAGGRRGRSANASGIGSAGEVWLRADRDPSGDGRVYHVAFTATAENGGACEGTVAICVPVKNGRGCADQGPIANATQPPSLAASNPPAGAASVAQASWLQLALDGPIPGKGAARLVCNGRRVPGRVTILDGTTLVFNPARDLPPESLCRLRYKGPRGWEEFLFGVGEIAESAPVPYDRGDLASLAPFPDDFWLVPDEDSASGRRLRFDGISTDPVANLVLQSIGAAIADRDGFSPYQTLIVALPEAPDPAALPKSEFESLDPLAPIGLFDMDPTSTRFGTRIPFNLTIRADEATDGTVDHTALIFPAVQLAAGGTHAFVVTRQLPTAATRSKTFGPSEFFAGVADKARSGDTEATRRARRSIGPVLDFLKAAPAVPILRDDVALALRLSVRSEVFDPSDLVAVKEAALAAPPPALQIDSITSTPQRAAVVRGTVGLASYLDPLNTSRLLRDPLTGLPVANGTEAVPFVLTLPEAAEAGPVPIVFYQHGSPGSPDEILSQEFLDDAGYALAGIQDFANRRFGMSSADQSTARFLGLLAFERLPLFDVQSVADMLGFLRALEGLGEQSLLPLAAPDAIPEIDPSKILFRGISNGSFLALAFLPGAPEVTAASALVGAGRVFETALHQLDIEADFRPLLPGARPGEIILGLAALENDADRFDPEYVARHLYREPLAFQTDGDAVPPSLLWVEGLDDTIVPNNATRSAARELGIPHVRPVIEATPVLEQLDSPVSGNLAPGVTAGFFQYDPAATPSCLLPFPFLIPETEGHFCPQLATEAERQTLHFFETALDPGQPAEIIDPFSE